jgi:hypothetical protein
LYIEPVIESIKEEIPEGNTPMHTEVIEEIKQDIYDEKTKPVKKSAGRYY